MSMSSASSFRARGKVNSKDVAAEGGVDNGPNELSKPATEQPLATKPPLTATVASERRRYSQPPTTATTVAKPAEAPSIASVPPSVMSYRHRGHYATAAAAAAAAPTSASTAGTASVPPLNPKMYNPLVTEYNPSTSCPAILRAIYAGRYRPIARAVEHSLDHFLSRSEVSKILENAKKNDSIGRAVYLYSADNLITFRRVDYCGIAAIVNEALINNNDQVLQLLGDFIYYLIVAIQQCPIVKKSVLWRGMVLDSVYADNNYSVLQSVTWFGFNSCSRKQKVAEIFATNPNNDENEEAYWQQKKAILCEIKNCTGYSIQAYSAFPEEEEVLLLPGSSFTTSSGYYIAGFYELGLVQNPHSEIIKTITTGKYNNKEKKYNILFYVFLVIVLLIIFAFFVL